jgi:hypothetical protein
MAVLTFMEIPEALRAVVPEFGPTIDEHVAEYDEVLAHVLFGDLTRFVLAAHERGDTDLEQRSLSFLERALREGDEQVQNLVAVSFVENVGPREQAQRDFIAAWPDALRMEAERQRDWKPPAP